MNDELEKLKSGDFTSRFRYFYVTRLKKYRFFRRARTFFGSDLGEAMFLAVMLVPAMIFLLLALPYMHWKVKREQEEYRRLYENRDRGWSDTQN